MKLARSSPWRSRSAIHSQSRTSVLRPGTFLMCCALTTSTSSVPSSRLYSGFQYTPVDSIATCVQPAATSQSTNASRSAVIVPNVRISLRGVAPAPGTIKQATIVFLCTSTPQQRVCTTSMSRLLSDGPRRAR
jgi:hypothetical protein